MNDLEQIEATRAYVALSNAHRLDWVFPMLSEDITYHSAMLGNYQGKAAVEQLMSSFFSETPNVFWQSSHYRNLGGRTIEFDFIRTGTDSDTGQPFKVPGTERVAFSGDGLICRIEVDKKEEE